MYDYLVFFSFDGNFDSADVAFGSMDLSVDDSHTGAGLATDLSKGPDLHKKVLFAVISDGKKDTFAWDNLFHFGTLEQFYV